MLVRRRDAEFLALVLLAVRLAVGNVDRALLANAGPWGGKERVLVVQRALLNRVRDLGHSPLADNGLEEAVLKVAKDVVGRLAQRNKLAAVGELGERLLAELGAILRTEVRAKGSREPWRSKGLERVGWDR